MAKAKIGLLPLYLKLYDDVARDVRPRIDEFYRTIGAELEQRGLTVITVPVCRLTSEFSAAVKKFEAEGADAIVTLHLAYSPSLESAGALARTRLPLIILDTTPTFSYGPGQSPDELMYNHGIHGVQDMCNLLLRNGKPFEIEAGHWQKSDVLDRVAALTVPARMASRMRGKVGLIGTSFRGMGDFYTPATKLRAAVGAAVKSLDRDKLKGYLASVSQEAIEEEKARDRREYQVEGDCDEAHTRSVRLGLALRTWVETERLSAFTFNFLDMRKSAGYPTVPFLEASKAMARGTGYAGEGDVLTALLVSAVAEGYPDSGFTEMFCPDWENGSILLSHMGELNGRLVEGRPLLREMDYHFSRTDNPVYLTGRFRQGDIVLVNCAPLKDGKYRLILAPAKMLAVSGVDRSEKSVHGWFRPNTALPDFLGAYSRAGGTHHLALAYTNNMRELSTFARMMGWEVTVLS